MKYVLAIAVAAILCAGMFAFYYCMNAQVLAWADAGAELSIFEKRLIYAAHAIADYWYAFSLLIATACVAVAAVIPMGRDEN